MKKILTVLSILLLTGCTVNYNLNIDDNMIEERISGNISKYEFDDIEDEYGDHNIYHLLYDNQKSLINKEVYYEQKINEIDDIIEFDYRYKYNNNYGYSTIVNRCFEKKMFEETEDLYVMHLSGDFYCQFANEIEVNVTTLNAVLGNNADRHENNTYTWILKEGSNDIDISLTVSKNIEMINSNKENSIFTPFRIVALIIFLILISMAFII